MRRWLRWGLRGTALAVALGAGLATGGVLWLTTDAGNQALRRLVERQVQARLVEGRFSLGGLHTNLVDGLALRQVELVDGRGEPLILAERIAVDWDLRGLLARRLTVARLRLDGPVVDLRAGPGGRLALLEVLGVPPGDPDAPPTAWQGLDARIDLDAVEIRGGRLAWPGGGLAELIADGQVQVAGRRVAVTGLSALGRLEGAVAGRVGAELDGALDEGDLVLDRLDLRLEGLRAGLTGRIAAVETVPRLDLALALDAVPAADLSRLLGSDGLIGQDLAGTLALRGPLDALAATLDLDAGAGGRLRATAGADLVAARPGWWVRAEGETLDLHALLPAATPEGLTLATAQVALGGSGLAWPDGLAVAGTVQARDLRVSGEALRAVEVVAVLGAQQVELLALRVDHDAGAVAGQGQVDLAGQRAALRLDAGLPRLAALSALAGTPLSGAARWAPQVELAWGDAVVAEATGPLRLDGLEASGVRLDGLAGPLELRWADGALRLGGGYSLAGLHGEAWQVDRGQGSWALRWSEAGTTIDAELDVEGLSSPLSAARGEAARGAVHLSLPRGGDLALQADLQLDQVRTAPGTPPGSGPLSLTIAGDAVQAEVGLRRPGAGPLLQGRVEGSLAEDATWTVHDLVLAPLPEVEWAAEGPLVATLGPRGVEAVDGVLDGSGGRLAVATDPTDGVIHLQAERLPLGTLAGLAALAPPAPEPAEEAAPSGAGAGLDAVGRVDLRLGRRADGSPEWLAGTVDLAALTVPGKVEGVDLRLGVDGPVEAPALALDVYDGTRRMLSARGVLPLDPGAPGLACGDGLDLQVALLPARVEQLRVRLPAIPAELVGHLSAELRAAGDPCDPGLRLVAAGETLYGPERERVRVDVDLRREGGAVETELWVEQGYERRIQVRGGASTSLGEVLASLLAGEELTPEVQERLVSDLALAVIPWGGLPLSALRSLVDLPPGLEGRLAGALSVVGTPASPRVQGALQLTEARLGAVPLDGGLLTVLPQDGGYVAELQLDYGPLPGEEAAAERSLSVRAVLPMQAGQSLDAVRAAEGFELLARGQLPLAMLVGNLDGVDEAEGVVDVLVTVGGSVDAPTVDATLAMDGGAVSYVPLGLRYEDLVLDLQATDQRVVLRRLAATNRKRWSPGRLGAARTRGAEATASVELVAFAPARVRGGVDLDGFWIIADLDRSVALNGALAVDGDWPALSVRGDLEVAEANLHFGEDFFGGGTTLEIDPTIRIERSNAQVVERTATDEAALWESFDLQVGVDLLRNLRLSAELPMNEEYGQEFAQLSTVGLDADLAGEVLLVQEGGALALQGEIETVRGTSSLLGGEFDVAGGTITFLGDSYDNPLVDITATRTTRYGDVDVHVRGLVDDLSFELRSADYPDQLDVVSLLLLGMPASELGDESQSRGELIGAALASLGTGQVEELVGSNVLDQFELDPAGAIRIGKALSDKLFLRLEQSWATDDDQGNRTEVTLEYLITRRLYAEFVTGDRAASSASLYWRWRF